ncbi:alpha-ketoglutarate-dependent dioxygenase AlkB family protein [Paraglaciecola aestuariivivens]
MQPSLFDSEYDNTPIAIQLPDADLLYWPNFIQAKLAEQYFSVLLNELAWRQEQIQIYGKSVAVPRLQAWYGDKGCTYQYSNLQLEPMSWTPSLVEIKHQCEIASASQFNSVLANLYRDGQDGMGLHADNEAELGKQPVIASVSLGQARTLRFVHQTKKYRHKITLNSGSLLIMQGNTQNYWKHEVPKSTKALGPRINLTFRRIVDF